MKPEEVQYVYDFIDENDDGKLQYKELADLLQGRRTIDPAKAIAERRKRKGLDKLDTDPDVIANQKASKINTLDTKETERTAGTVDGMSTLMRRSDAGDRKVPSLVNENEHIENFNEIKETFMRKCFAFEDLLNTMGLVKPGNETRITFEDFFKAVSQICGANKFSRHSIRSVFKNQAVGVEKADPETLKGAYIPARDFKDKFYPGRIWKPDMETPAERVERLKREKEQAREGQESNVDSESIAISQIMQGVSYGDIKAEQDKLERAQIAAD